MKTVSISMYIICGILCLFVALSRRVGALEISIITINAIEQIFVIHARWILPGELGEG